MVERSKPEDNLTPSIDWRPTASLATLRKRAEIIAAIRRFFAERGVLEVDTPALSRASTTDPNLESLQTTFTGPGAPGGATLFLHTSPEFAMKRLLAAGSGSIYQICHVFRDGESGRLHNPEFTMLEYYQVGLDHRASMQHALELLTAILAPYRELAAPTVLSYADAFARYAGVNNVHTTDCASLRAAISRLGLDAIMAERPDTVDILRDLILTHAIEPKLEQNRLTALYDYPVTQAALARIRPGTPAVAERFEIYLDGVELANGFHELNDATEQRLRFDHDLEMRRSRGQSCHGGDERLLAALASGLPDCAGVAIGIDRVVMLAVGETDLARVIAFPFARA